MRRAHRKPDYPAALLTERINGDTELAARTLDAALSAHEGDDDPDLETIDAADAWARRFTGRHIRARAPV